MDNANGWRGCASRAAADATGIAIRRSGRAARRLAVRGSDEPLAGAQRPSFARALAARTFALQRESAVVEGAPRQPRLRGELGDGIAQAMGVEQLGEPRID